MRSWDTDTGLNMVSVLCQSPSGAEEASSLGCVGHQSLSHRTARVRTWVCVWHEVRSGASPPRAWSSAGSVSSVRFLGEYWCSGWA